MMAGAEAELLQLLVLLVDFAAGTDVDGKGEKNDDPITVSVCGRAFLTVRNSPNRPVEDGNAENVPLRRGPAPQRCVSKHAPLLGCADKDHGDGDDEGNPVAAQKIGYLHPSQPLSVKLKVEGEVHIHSHG